VSDYTLTKESPLNGVEHEFEGVTVAEVIDQSLVMVAIPTLYLMGLNLGMRTMMN